MNEGRWCKIPKRIGTRTQCISQRLSQRLSRSWRQSQGQSFCWSLCRTQGISQSWSERRSLSERFGLFHIQSLCRTFRYASLRFATLRYASLRFASLSFTELHFTELHWASLSFTELSIISSQPEPLPLLSLRSTLHLYYLYYLYYLSNPSTFNQYLRNIQWIRLTRVRAEHLSEYHISTNRIVRSFVRSFTHNWILPHRSLYLWR